MLGIECVFMHFFQCVPLFSVHDGPPFHRVIQNAGGYRSAFRDEGTLSDAGNGGAVNQRGLLQIFYAWVMPCRDRQNRPAGEKGTGRTVPMGTGADVISIV